MKIGKHMNASIVGMTPHEVWTIHDKRGGTLGHVEWHAQWKAYVFSPEFGAVFSSDCMSAMAHFLDCATSHVEIRANGTIIKVEE